MTLTFLQAFERLNGTLPFCIAYLAFESLCCLSNHLFLELVHQTRAVFVELSPRKAL
jgi:hypothetical protein